MNTPVTATKQPGFRGVADAATTGVVTGCFEVVGQTVKLDL